MALKPDQERVKNLLTDTVTLLCKNGLLFNEELRIEGLLGVTLDNKDAFFVHISEKYCGTAAGDDNVENPPKDAADALRVMAEKSDAQKVKSRRGTDESPQRNENNASPKSVPSRPSSHSSVHTDNSPAHKSEKRCSIDMSSAVEIKSEPVEIDSKENVQRQLSDIQSPGNAPRVPLPHGPVCQDFISMEIPPDLQHLQGQFPFGGAQGSTCEPPLKRRNVHGHDHNSPNSASESWQELASQVSQGGQTPGDHRMIDSLAGSSTWSSPGGAPLGPNRPPSDMVSVI